MSTVPPERTTSRHALMRRAGLPTDRISPAPSLEYALIWSAPWIAQTTEGLARDG
jgi:hypothetical protein